MNLAIGLCFCLMWIGLTSSLNCWECHNANTNDECLRTGRMVTCNEENAMCEDQVRHGDGGRMIIIEKRCKQAQACETNVYQNLQAAYPIQCNLKSPTSTCRCCCDTDMCNVELLACWRFIPQYSSPLSREKCPSRPDIPENANMQCNGNMEPGTYCRFKCHDGFVMNGRIETTCLDDLSWSYSPPECVPITCPPARVSPGNGTVSCSDGINLRSHCIYTCNRDYALEGRAETHCIDVGFNNGTGVWTNMVTPYCRPLFCSAQESLPHGRVQCSRSDFKFETECRFSCDENFELYPSGLAENQCLFSGEWSAPTPCCTLPCPPNLVMDFVVVLDSSSSVGAENWQRIKGFVRSFLDDFAVRDNAAHYAIVRYNREVDTQTQILFSDFPNDIDGLLNAFDEIPYDGSGTHTGNALNHTADVLLRVGNRLKARDVVLLITDGASQDDVVFPAQRVRDTGALVYVLPVQPPRGRLDMEEIQEIAGPGNSHNVLTAALTGGFDALDEEFAREMSSLLCSEPCVDPFLNQ